MNSRRRGQSTAILALLVLAMVIAPFSSAARPAFADGPNVPYDLPVQLPQANATSPAVDANAPYTPVVLSLLAQLLPSNPPTQAELANASKLLVYGAILFGPSLPGCYGTGPVAAPTGTTPSIEQICWADAQGILMTSGPNQRNTTAPMTLMGLAASFDRDLGNVWGQTEGKEARWYMITGIYGPQGDIDVTPNWGRNLTTTGEDPYLSEQLVAAQVNGMQGAGAQSQMKHFAVYNGQNGNTTYQDQWLHEIGLAPYEGGYVLGKASAAMCSYQASQNISAYLPGPISSLWPASPFATGNEPETWPLNEMHYACEQPELLNYVLRQQWGSHAYVASDYGALHSTSSIFQGDDQEMPSKSFYGTTDPYGTGGGFPPSGSGFDATGSTCADPNTGLQVACSTPGAIHVAGIPSGSACKLDATGGGGCGLVNAVLNGTMPLSVFKQALARILYQEERFGLLGCSDNPPSPLCTNPGGNGTSGGDKPGTGTRTGTVILPDGPTSGMPVIGTKNGDAAIVEKYSEMGATLLKNDGRALPLTDADLANGVLIAGSSANHTVADPTGEASMGFIDRNAVNPLQQLIAFSGKPEAFTFVPANDPTGMPVKSGALSTQNGSVTGSLKRTGPDGTQYDTVIDYTAASGNGQLAPGSYTWEGYVYVPASDTYTFRFQSSAGVPKANVTFSFDGTLSNTLIDAENVYGASVPGTPTNAGYTEALLNNQKCALDTDRQGGGGFCFPGQVCPPPTPYPNSCQSSLAGGSYHAVKITFNNNSGAPASFRFAYSRANGDIADAAAAATGKSKAIVFVNDGTGTSSTIPNPYKVNPTDPDTISAPISLSAASTNLINAVAAANPNTIVVLNTANPVLTPWAGSVKSILEMWFAGQEGGTSTARLLLGLANPSGHTAITWPKNATDTIWAYDQPEPLYPGDTTGPHLERYGTGTAIGPSGGGSSSFTQGIYSGYRFFDKLNIEPQFAFGHGLSYTTFDYRNLVLKSQKDGTVRVSFVVQNKGDVAGVAVPQVYLGPAPSVPDYVQQAVRALRGFSRVELQPNEAKRVEITLNERSFEYWDERAQAWMFAPGPRTIWVGESSRDLRLSGQAAPNKRNK